ncbi:enterobactin synthetase component F [Actinoplanes lutulentus]|uniref:Enterobactin synthetase component F n=1 Tax=Actinoplanes lutulentus TaxID=1287878 RepID=A0A327ZDX8_9ACTN|nr:non-ribosomal peptide synthetase [Actinoplanes lutulentus]MBB2942548.1 enterobactin synthetase component F [Actinoplanes lutulentus]RAK38129.1 enterobactin synthetase component F [Actinoplanes lutulentus]
MDVDHRPLTAPQQALWFAQLLDPQNPSYLCAHRITIDGPLDTDRLAEAIRQVTEATDVLRTGFAAEGDQVWRIEQPATGPEIVDLPGEAAVRRWIDADLAEALPLTGAPLVRQAVLRTGPEQAVWYFRAHHILLDGYAFAMVTEKVVAAYAALGRGSTFQDAFPAAFRTVDSLAEDERAYIASDRFADDRRFWLDRLKNTREPVTLSQRPAPTSHRYAHRHIELPESTADELRAAADRLGVTWAEAAYAITALYLHRITGEADLTLGMPVSGRLGTGAARVPVSVVNVLPLRLAAPEGITLRALVAAVRDELRAVSRHQRYRYEWLQRDLGLVGTGRRLSGPQVNVKPFRRSLDLGPGVSARVHYLATGPTEDLEVTVGLDAGTGRLDLTVDANPDSYSDEELDGHFARLIRLFTTFADIGPDQVVSEVDVLTDTERDLVLRAWNETASRVPEKTLTTLLAQQAARTPHAPAVRAEGVEISYAELHERADRLARWLAERGAKPGTLVAVAIPRGIDLMVALLGVLRSGAGYLPLDLSYPADRLAFMVEDAQPVVVLRELPSRCPVPLIEIGQASPSDTAYAIYTSGSTGRPKGVLVPHRGIVNRLLWMQHEYRLAPGERVLQKTPIGFDVSVWELFWPLITGATLVMAKPEGHKDPAYLASLIVQERVTTVHFVPSMLRVFLGEEAAASTRATLRRVICSGEELPEDLTRRFHAVIGSGLHNLYGPTEASVDVTYQPVLPSDPPGPVPIGRPVWNTQIYLLDAGRRPVPPGVPGELYIAGAQLASGYLNRPALTAERFLDDPLLGRLYRAGDLAKWRFDGTIEFLGRTDGQVKIRGFRVELGEIEALLNEHPAVGRAAVALIDGRLCAYVVGDLDLEGVRAYLAPLVPDHMLPGAVVEMSELPLTPSGKLDRQALPAPAAAVSGGTLRTPAEVAVARLMAEVLEVPLPGPDDNFFDLGGHSLLAVTLVQRIRASLGSELSLAAVFAAPTVAGLAARLDPSVAGTDGLGVVLPLRAGSGPALFVVHPAGGLAWCYSGLLAHLDPSVAVYGIQSPAFTAFIDDSASLAETAARYITEIQDIRPGGPYALAGWSIGGVLAQEIAAALRAAGEEVSMLALLDAYPSDQWRDLPAPSSEDALRALLHMAGRDESAVGGPLTVESVVGVLRRADSPLAELGDDVLAKIPLVVAENARMMREHQHRFYDGDALIFVAAAPRAEDWLSASAWGSYIGGEVVVRELDCTHPGMVSPAALKIIANDLNPHLAG